MEPVDEARFDAEGMEGDEHRGPDSIRQVLVEDMEILDALELSPGQVKENVTVSGVEANALPPGARLTLGEVVIELTKECAPCSRMEEIRPGLQEQLQRKRGVYARVVRPGTVRVGDPVTVEALEEVAGS
jgi:MOSC domain-containing protein YiiM